MTIGSVYNQRTGDIWITDFDRGVVTTLGGEIDSSNKFYVIKNLPGIAPPPNFEGVPIYFSLPDESVDDKIMPSFIVRRDAAIPAMSRWHLGLFDYNVPAKDANPVTITNPYTGAVMASGYDAYERKDQAVPYDITYTIQIRARYRNNLSVGGLKMLRYLMKVYQPYSRVAVGDSLGDTRYYDVFAESPGPQDIMPDITGRETDFNYTIRVEGELDLNDPYVTKVATSMVSNLTTK